MIYDVKIHTNNRDRSFIFIVDAENEEEAKQMAVKELKRQAPELSVREGGPFNNLTARLSKLQK